jgi:phosphatidylserine decarboxylase
MNIFKKIIVGLHAGILFLVGKAPTRKIPAGDHVISPAHGKVIEIKDVENATIVFHKKGVVNHVLIPELTFPARMVVIEMTPLDVHVQRAPIDGTILRIDHYHGRHHNAMGHEMLDLVTENEKVVAVFENKKETICVIQVAGIAARRIRNIAEVGDEFAKGDIYGRILFGSQVVILIPRPREILVSVGDRVVDGETILAK